MPLPLIPIIWAVTKFTVIAGAVKGTALSAVRLVQHGFDYEATLEQLEKDIKASKTFSLDTIKLVPALAKLRVSDDYEEICASAKALENVLSQLPQSMRDGFNKSLGLETRIDTALKQSINRCGASLLAHAVGDSTTDVSTRLKALYFGLFLVGRSNNVLDTEHQVVILDTLTSLHNVRGQNDDTAAIECLTTYQKMKDYQHMTGRHILLEANFQGIPEVAALYELESPSMAAAYIAQALGDHISCTEHTPFLTYMNTYLMKRKVAS